MHRMARHRPHRVADAVAEGGELIVSISSCFLICSSQYLEFC